MRSGRALVYPIYKSQYERGDGLASDDPDETARYRDHVIYWGKDLGRTIDYLETRKDLNLEKLAYYGLVPGHIWEISFQRWRAGSKSRCFWGEDSISRRRCLKWMKLTLHRE